MNLKQIFAVIGIAAIMASTVQAETPQPATHRVYCHGCGFAV